MENLWGLGVMVANMCSSEEKSCWISIVFLLLELIKCSNITGKPTWQWKMDLLKMYSLLKMGIFYCHVSLLEGNTKNRSQHQIQLEVLFPELLQLLKWLWTMSQQRLAYGAPYLGVFGTVNRSIPKKLRILYPNTILRRNVILNFPGDVLQKLWQIPNLVLGFWDSNFGFLLKKWSNFQDHLGFNLQIFDPQDPAPTNSSS